VLRTQRAAFQEWVDGAPWAAPGEVTIVLRAIWRKSSTSCRQRRLSPNLHRFASDPMDAGVRSARGP
jgi:hypothetical protein